MAELVVAKAIAAKIDRPAGVVVFAPPPQPEAQLNAWAGNIGEAYGGRRDGGAVAAEGALGSPGCAARRGADGQGQPQPLASSPRPPPVPCASAPHPCPPCRCPPAKLLDLLDKAVQLVDKEAMVHRVPLAAQGLAA